RTFIVEITGTMREIPSHEHKSQVHLFSKFKVSRDGTCVVRRITTGSADDSTATYPALSRLLGEEKVSSHRNLIFTWMERKLIRGITGLRIGFCKGGLRLRICWLLILITMIAGSLQNVSVATSKTLNLAQKVKTTSASYQAPVRGEPARSLVQRTDDGKTWCISKGYDTSSGNDETPNGRERSKRT
ncbi:hypothetical protein Tco_0103268, partial [Tanacetum coccineum]